MAAEAEASRHKEPPLWMGMLGYITLVLGVFAMVFFSFFLEIWGVAALWPHISGLAAWAAFMFCLISPSGFGAWVIGLLMETWRHHGA